MPFLSFHFEKKKQMSTGKQKWIPETAQSLNFKKILKKQQYSTFPGHYTITELIISWVQIGNKVQVCVGEKDSNPYVYLDLFC